MHKTPRYPPKGAAGGPPKRVVFWTFLAANKCPFLPLRAEIFKKRRFSRPDHNAHISLF